MKNFKNTPKRLVAGLCAVCLLTLTLSSCLKTHDAGPVTPVALLSVIQDSPGQPALDFTLDGTRVNSAQIAYGSGLDYFSAFVGTRTAAFVKTGGAGTVFSDTIMLKQNFAYTICLIGTTATPGYLKLKDAITQPPSGNANLRFVDLSPDAPAVDLAVKDGAVLVSNKSFKGFSDFAAIPGKNYTFEIRKAGTTTVLTTLTNASINSGFVYTIYLRGLVAATDNTKLTAALITNAYPGLN